MPQPELTADHTPSVQGRILLICFRFGPGCDTGGYRWNAMVRDLTRLGWNFDVITVGSLEIEGGGARLDRYYHDGAVEIFQISQDWWGQYLRQAVARLRQKFDNRLASNASATSSDTQRKTGSSSKRLRRIRQTLTAATEIMRDMSWVRRAQRVARRLASERAYHCVVVSSPRHLTHLVGADVARRSAIPYVPDYRDPWYYGRGMDRDRLDLVTRFFWRRYERRCMRQARIAIDISEGAQRAVEQELDAALAVPRYFIPSGYDRIDEVREPDYQCFRIVYTGTLYAFNPVPEVLAACNRLRERHGLTPEMFRIEFMGIMPEFDGLAPQRLAQNHGLGAYFRHLPRRPASEASALQQDAAVLLAFDSVCVNALCIPSKLYHYAQMKGMLLLVGDPDGAMAHEARKIDELVYAPTDPSSLDARLDAAYMQWRERRLTQRTDRGGLFDSRRQGQRMHEVLSTLGQHTADLPPTRG